MNGTLTLIPNGTTHGETGVTVSYSMTDAQDVETTHSLAADIPHEDVATAIVGWMRQLDKETLLAVLQQVSTVAGEQLKHR